MSRVNEKRKTWQLDFSAYGIAPERSIEHTTHEAEAVLAKSAPNTTSLYLST